ncbi:fungal-specific transcription factor domain-containing protein [Roridomyces roridus]|uniref:Fungal-specific transcription factor domain-containing protein n=1 Tax=Roridomyces roridus TaxID=1738132 RepID=A0AAD7BY13_9AGAR|nr:fungal-specific transcription factor domain-containing protein [Roridomyces roridus]
MSYRTPPSDEPRSKKRRNGGACDHCDSGQMPGNRCTNCVTSGLDCTHAEIMKTIGSAKGYVESLETRLEKMEKLLNKLLPGIDFTEQLENEEEPSILEQVGTSLPRNDADELVGAIKKLTLNPEEHRFFGKSSGIQFVQTALNFKSHFADPQAQAPNAFQCSSATLPWLLPPADDTEDTQYTFPEPDLLASLIDLYFKEVNYYFPTLHRPTFERKVKDNLHLRDHRFAGTLLMVCSLGARHSDDTRTFLPGENNGHHTAGWKWHNQVRVIPKYLIYKPNLYELQTIALSSLFLLSLSPVAWNQIGFGLRRCQDVGAHRRMKQPHPTPESEQWKRVFWVLLCLDWMSGTSTGRPLAMHEQDYDQDYPVDCDDEFWDLPAPLSFKQPSYKPSDLTYFNTQAKLLVIQASITSTIYSPRKPTDITGRSTHTSDAQNIIAFDSALNSWLMEIPDHLKWDPDRENLLHFNQSAALHSVFYNVQIMVHRPYIPAPLETSRPGALPSLAICTNAARSCARIISAQEKPSQPVAFTAAIVLLLNMWSGRRSGFPYNPGKELDDVYKCINLLARAEKRYLAAGRFNDIIHRLISVGDVGNDGPFTKQYKEQDVPPSAQRGYELSVFSSAPQPGPMEAPVYQFGAERIEDTLRTRLHSAVAPETPDLASASIFSDFTGTGNGYNGITELEQLLRMDPPQLSDADVMSMWSAAPTGFHSPPEDQPAGGTPKSAPLY